MKKYQQSTAIDRLPRIQMRTITKHLEQAERDGRPTRIYLRTCAGPRTHLWVLTYDPRGNTPNLLVVWHTPDGERRTSRLMVGWKRSNLGKGRIRLFVCPATGRLVFKVYLAPWEGFFSRYAFTHWHYTAAHDSHRQRLMNKFYTATSRIEDWPTRYLSYAGRPTRRTRRLAHWCLRQASLERQLSAIVQIWKESGGLDDLLSDWPDI